MCSRASCLTPRAQPSVTITRLALPAAKTGRQAGQLRSESTPVAVGSWCSGLLAASPVRDTYAHAPPGQATLIKVTAFASVDAPWKTGTPQSHLVRARYDPNWSMRNGKHVVVGQ